MQYDGCRAPAGHPPTQKGRPTRVNVCLFIVPGALSLTCPDSRSSPFSILDLFPLAQQEHNFKPLTLPSSSLNQ
jgi:hypothetical protein